MNLIVLVVHSEYWMQSYELSFVIGAYQFRKRQYDIVSVYLLQTTDNVIIVIIIEYVLLWLCMCDSFA